jgi:heme exporter protein CcmD
MLRFLQMGGYAVYVWPSYALALLAVVLNIYWARRSLRDAQSQTRLRLERANRMKVAQ